MPGLAAHGDYGAVLALVAPRPFLVAARTRDPIFPADGIEETVAAAREAFRARRAADRLGPSTRRVRTSSRPRCERRRTRGWTAGSSSGAGDNDMAELAASVLVEQLSNVLREAVEGPSGPWTFFIDKVPDAGLFGVLAGLHAADASRLVGGSTIAAHVHHVAFGMDVTAAAVHGDRDPRDWTLSWASSAVDETGWDELRDRLRRADDGLRRAFAEHATLDDVSFGEAVGGIAHIAYHLGAIRQKVVGLRS